MIDILNFIRTRDGRIIISIIWGLGLASLFKKVCSDRDCIVYKAPNHREMISNVYRHNNKCYKYSVKTTSCNKNPIH